MLLRRLMGHFKDQSWAAVVLDLFVVILGVFIGFQVTAWNEERQAQAAEHNTLLRLQIESEQVVAFWQLEVRLQSQFNENRRTLLDVLDKGLMTPEQRPAVDDALMRIAHYPHFNPPRSVYNELVAAGGLGKISDTEVRDAVSEYSAELDFVMGQLTQFRAALPVSYAAFQNRIFSKYAPGEKSMRTYEYDVAVLAGDRQFVSAMVDAVRGQLQFLTIRQNVLDRATIMCESVSQALSMTCDVPEISDEEIRARDGINQ